MSQNIRARIERLESRWSTQAARTTLRRFPDWLDNDVHSQSWAHDLAAEMPGADWQYKTLPAQRTFHSDLRTRFKGYSGPIGSGKSHALVYEALFLS